MSGLGAYQLPGVGHRVDKKTGKVYDDVFWKTTCMMIVTSSLQDISSNKDIKLYLLHVVVEIEIENRTIGI